MDTQQALERIQSIRNAIILANQGRGDKPSREEVKEALSLLRKSRAAAEAAKPTKKKAPEVNLNDLFANMPGAPNGNTTPA